MGFPVSTQPIYSVLTLSGTLFYTDYWADQSRRSRSPNGAARGGQRPPRRQEPGLTSPKKSRIASSWHGDFGQVHQGQPWELDLTRAE